MKKKKYLVKVIHEFEIEAENEEEANQIVLDMDGYGESKDCYLETKEI